MTITVAALSTDALTTPLGIDDARPEFAWKLVTDREAVVQTGFTIQVSTSGAFEGDVVWESGRVASGEPFGVRYAGPPLDSMRRYWWRVRVWCAVGSAPRGHGPGGELAAGWSEPSWFETAVLDPALWRARWITGPPPASREDDAVVYLRGALDLPAGVVRARAYVSALGWYRLLVNGADLTGHALVPRWTPFDRIVEYQTYDVTDALAAGGNVLALAVGDGRFRGALGMAGARGRYGDRVAAFAQFEVELDDGSTVTATTDGSWWAGPGRITGADPQLGERADLRVPDADWSTDPAPPARFGPARLLSGQDRVLVAEEVGRVRDVDRLRPTVVRAPSGAQILDFGQNFAGVVRIRLSGPAGRTVQLTHSELLTRDGELDTEYILLDRKKPRYQRDTVVLAGTDEWYAPWFTVHGFRYVSVVGLVADLDPTDVEGLVLSSDLPSTGAFECSDPRLERLHRNVFWSLRSNFGDTPTDCPTRERSGWTGDIQVFAPTGAGMVDEQAYLRRYLRILALEQYPDGAVPPFVPSEGPTTPGPGRRLMHLMSRSAGWADAAVLVPWTLYEYYGDRTVLERQYDSMRRWVEHMARAARRPGRGLPLRAVVRADLRASQRYLLSTGFHFGEWLRPGEEARPTMLRNALRPPTEIATAYFARSAAVLARTAEVLGRAPDAGRYAELADRVRAAWRAAFVGPDGRIAHDRQDDYVRALAFDLLLPEQRAAAVRRLAELVEAAGDHLTTGFLSTPMLLTVLVGGGRADLAMRLLLQITGPSWLHQVERGATTVWETWEGYRDDGTGTGSHNHYALGAVAGWLTEQLAGLSPAEPGYRRIRIAPLVTDALTHAGCSVDTPYGTARSAWRRPVDRAGDPVVLEVVVPPGTTAEVHLPGSARGPELVPSGRHRFTWRPGRSTEGPAAPGPPPV